MSSSLSEEDKELLLNLIKKTVTADSLTAKRDIVNGRTLELVLTALIQAQGSETKKTLSVTADSLTAKRDIVNRS